MRDIPLARTPDDPTFAVALLKLVLELRRNRRQNLDDAIVRVLKGMRVDREAFRNHVHSNQERFVTAAAGLSLRRRSA